MHFEPSKQITLVNTTFQSSFPPAFSHSQICEDFSTHPKLEAQQLISIVLPSCTMHRTSPSTLTYDLWPHPGTLHTWHKSCLNQLLFHATLSTKMLSSLGTLLIPSPSNTAHMTKYTAQFTHSFLAPAHAMQFAPVCAMTQELLSLSLHCLSH